MSKAVVEDAKAGMLEGARKVYAPVSATLGAQGKTVFSYEKQKSVPDGQGGFMVVPQKLVATKDGVTVATNDTSSDPIEAAGQMLIREVSQKTVDECDDATTTSTILAYELMKNGTEQMKGRNHVEFCRGIEQATKDVVAQLDELARPVDTQELATQIATTSANNDRELGEMIGEACFKIGLGGVISVEKSSNYETTYDIVSGLAVASGYKYHEFINTMRGTCELINPLVILYNGPVKTIADIKPIMIQAMEHKRPLLIVADVQDEALQSLIVNKQQGVLDSCVLIPPGMGEDRDDNMLDIAAVTGAEYISLSQGRQFKEVRVNPKAGVKKVIVGKRESKLIEGYGDTSARKGELQEKLKTETRRKDWLKARYSMLDGGVGRIIVGGKTQTEMSERYDRVEDAVGAVRTAAEEGYVAGGGSALRFISNAIGSDTNYIGESDDFLAGLRIVLEACRSIEAKIHENASHPYEGKFNADYGVGFDAKELEEGVNLIERGIIDPKKSNKCALENAASNAITFLKTDFLLHDV